MAPGRRRPRSSASAGSREATAPVWRGPHRLSSATRIASRAAGRPGRSPRRLRWRKGPAGSRLVSGPSGGLRPEKPQLDQREYEDDGKQKDRERRCVSDSEELEGVLVDVEHRGRGRAGGSAVGE